MFNLLNNWKLYLLSFALIGALTSNAWLKYQNLKLEGQLQVCNANLSANLAAINIANEMRADQEKKLRLREQDAAKAQAESLKRRDNTLHTVITGGCNGANDFLIDYALNFNWDNNIP